jgi:hypothetical protein
MVMVSFVLAITLGLLERFNGPLEVGLGFFKVTLGLVSLLLQEFVLSLPQAFVFIVVVHLVLQVTFEISSFSSVAIEFTRLVGFVSFKVDLELFVDVSKTFNLDFVSVGTLFLLVFKILCLENEDSFLAFKFSGGFGKATFSFFESLSLSFVFDFDGLFFHGETFRLLF